MKVCFINSLYYPDAVGGAEKSVQSLAETLVAGGHQAFVISTARQGKEYQVNGVKVYAIDLTNVYWPYGKKSKFLKPFWHTLDSYNPVMAGKVADILDKESPDVVHTNNLSGFSVAVFAKIKKRGIPLIHTLRDYYLLCARCMMFDKGENCRSQCRLCRVCGVSRKALSAHVDHVVGISRYILDEHLAHGYFPQAVPSVIHNSYKLPPNIAIRHEAVQNKVRFGFIGRLEPNKGVDLLIRAVRACGLDSPVSLVIAGTGEHEYTRYLMGLAEGMNVAFLGYVAPNDFFPKIDVTVVPSLWNEALGRVVIESYAYGTPAIASQRGGLPEIVDYGETGFVFDPDDIDSLTALINRFSGNQSLVESMREACYEKAGIFSPEKIVGDYLNLYQMHIRPECLCPS